MGFIETSYGSNPNLSQVNIDSDLNMQNYDVIGVKQFICEDYMSALKPVASETEAELVILDDLNDTSSTNKRFRIPSNFIQGTIRIKYYTRSSSASTNNGIYKYDPETGTTTTIFTHTTAANTNEWVSYDATVNAGDIFGLWCQYSGSYVGGATQGVKICYDSYVQNGAVWVVE